MLLNAVVYHGQLCSVAPAEVAVFSSLTVQGFPVHLTHSDTPESAADLP